MELKAVGHHTLKTVAQHTPYTFQIYKKLASRQILNRILCEGTRHTPLLERLMDGDTDELSIRNEALSRFVGI